MSSIIKNIALKTTRNGRKFTTYTIETRELDVITTRNCCSFIPQRLRSSASVEAWLMTTLGLALEVRIDALAERAVAAHRAGGEMLSWGNSARLLEQLRRTDLRPQRHGSFMMWHFGVGGFEVRAVDCAGRLTVNAYVIEGREDEAAGTTELVKMKTKRRAKNTHHRTPETRKKTSKPLDPWTTANRWYRAEVGKAGLSKKERDAVHAVILEENHVTTSKDMTPEELQRVARTLRAVPRSQRGEYLRALI